MNRGLFRRLGLYWLALLAAVSADLPAAPCYAQLRFSGDQQLARRLDEPVSLAWEGQQLAAGLERLADARRITVWIDRRIDPAAPVELAASEQTLRDVLAAIAAPHDWAAAPYHGVLYFGPKQTAHELATLSALARETIASAPSDVRARWLKAQAWSFPRLSEPRSLLKEIARSAGAQVIDDHLVAHDLFPSRSLPAMSPLDRAVLLLAGFDLTCRISADGRQLRVVPIDHEHLQAVTRGSSSRQAAVRPRPQPTAGAEKRFTLKIENQPAHRVIDQLARQLQLKVEWAPSLEQARDALVSCDVREADLDGLLTAVLSPAGLAFERDGQKVKIRRAE